MPIDITTFSTQLKAETKGLIESEIVKLHRLIVIDALKRIVEKTPVDTGAARANWQVSIGIRKRSALKRKDKDGGNTVVKGIEALTGLGPFELVFIQNNLDYISVLEEGGFVPADPGPSKDPRKDRKGRILVAGGFSVQAPNGMVQVTLVELEGIYS